MYGRTYTLDIFLMRYYTTKMETLLNELLKMSKCSEEDMILIEGLRLLQRNY